jgi:hypothetical protein
MKKAILATISSIVLGLSLTGCTGGDSGDIPSLEEGTTKTQVSIPSSTENAGVISAVQGAALKISQPTDLNNDKVSYQVTGFCTVNVQKQTITTLKGFNIETKAGNSVIKSTSLASIPVAGANTKLLINYSIEVERSLSPRNLMANIWFGTPNKNFLNACIVSGTLEASAPKAYKIESTLSKEFRLTQDAGVFKPKFAVSITENKAKKPVNDQSLLIEEVSNYGVTFSPSNIVNIKNGISNTFTINYPSNDTLKERIYTFRASIENTMLEFSVTQDGLGDIEFNKEASTIPESFEKPGGNYTFVLNFKNKDNETVSGTLIFDKAGKDYGVIIPKSEYVVTNGTSEPITLTIPENISSVERNYDFNVSFKNVSEKFSIKQAAYEFVVKPAKAAYIVGSKATNLSIPFAVIADEKIPQNNKVISWNLTSDDLGAGSLSDFIDITSGNVATDSVNGNGIINLVLKENLTPDVERSLSLVITYSFSSEYVINSEEITIKQSGKETVADSIVITPEDITVGSEGVENLKYIIEKLDADKNGKKEEGVHFTCKTNVPSTFIEINENINLTTDANGVAILELDVKENQSGVERTATISCYDNEDLKTVTLTQNGEPGGYYSKTILTSISETFSVDFSKNQEIKILLQTKDAETGKKKGSVVIGSIIAPSKNVTVSVPTSDANGNSIATVNITGAAEHPGTYVLTFFANDAIPITVTIEHDNTEEEEKKASCEGAGGYWTGTECKFPPANETTTTP